MNSLSLHWRIIIGMILGVFWSIISSLLGLSQFTINWISPFGDIFINLLKLIAIPLVLFSVIKGISSISNISLLGRIGLKTLFAYLMTTVLSVSIGLLLVNCIKPGSQISLEQRQANHLVYQKWSADELLSDGSGFLPGDNLSKEKIKQMKIDADKHKNNSPLQFIVDLVPSNIFLSLTDNKSMLKIIFFAIFFGITIVLISKKEAVPVIAMVDALNSVFLKMVDVVMLGAPFFVFALLSGVISKLAGDDLSGVLEIFKGLGVYSLVVFFGLATMVFLIYPILMYLFTGKTYKDFFQSIASAQMLAFSTSSSAATLPVTMDCVHSNLGVSKRVTGFVLPIGATVNMDGTSLYQAVAVVFLAQMHMVDLNLTQQLTIVFTATMASIGSAAVPSAGLIMLIIVLDAVGLNPAWISIIFPVDRILDMCRTVVNVTGDATVSSIVDQSEKNT
ncbi:MAG: dicarboxylate/amino acid:cation symporter [Flavobacteriales bacterium]|nr:dicarboxylate/amino acid:cation symporter [Flavobacteriales bacterium]|tara:strand:- start:1045 stop:2388 length:1344 start_codon:yes stop_codon:yes gene_type:complete